MKICCFIRGSGNILELAARQTTTRFNNEGVDDENVSRFVD
jgi:hypothetical protein